MLSCLKSINNVIMIVAMYIVGICIFLTYIILQIWEVYFRRKENNDSHPRYYSRHNNPERRD